MTQTKAFCKFLPVIVVLYLGKTQQMHIWANSSGTTTSDLDTGFLTTFTMLARDRMSLNEMSWLLIKVFFGFGDASSLPSVYSPVTQVELSWIRCRSHGMGLTYRGFVL